MASVFFSYSHKDEVLRNELEAHLALLKHEGLVDAWHDRRIVAGNEVDDAIFGQLEAADIILLLVSSDFITHMQAWWKRYHTAFAEEALPSFLRGVKPDYCILFPAWYPNLTREPWLTAVGQFQYPNNTGGGNELVVYRISGVPTGPMERRAGAP